MIGIEKPDNTLDKSEIAKIIFENSELREKLEALLHPMVFDNIQNYLKKISGKRRLIIVEVPLLFEGGYQGRFERTITVFTTQKTAIERLMKAGVSRSNALEEAEGPTADYRSRRKMQIFLLITMVRSRGPAGR